MAQRNDIVNAPTPPAKLRRQRNRGESGLQPLFLIMCGVVLAVCVGGYLMFSPDAEADNDSDATGTPRVNEQHVSRKNRPFQKVEPWTGTIAGKKGHVEVGMTRQEIVDQFGLPPGRTTNAHRTDNGVDSYEYPDAGATGAGILGQTSGVALIVTFDRGEDRRSTPDDQVVWFRPPVRANGQ